MRKSNPALRELEQRLGLNFFNISEMAKRIKSKLKDGEVLVGQLEELNDNSVIVKGKDGVLTQLQIESGLNDAISEDVSYGDIMRLKAEGDEYVLDVLEDWPKDGKA